MQYLASECHFDKELDASKQREFFFAPCLHFPRQRKEWKNVWRIGNIVELRRLKGEPSHWVHQLASAEVLTMNPKSQSIHDPTAVLTLRWYHESNVHGDVLPGFQNKACKGRYHLPTSGETRAEPVELVANHVVIEQKCWGIWAYGKQSLATSRA